MDENKFIDDLEIDDGIEDFSRECGEHKIILEGKVSVDDYIAEIKDFRAVVELFRTEIYDGKLEVSGEAQLQIDYTGELVEETNEEISEEIEEIDESVSEEGKDYNVEYFTKQFSKLIDDSGLTKDSEIDCDIKVESIDYNLDNGELSYWLELQLIITKFIEQKVESECEEVDISVQQEEKSRENQKTYIKMYMVQEGDTLNELAQKFRVSADRIKEANNIKHPDMIFKGQKLFIPLN